MYIYIYVYVCVYIYISSHIYKLDQAILGDDTINNKLSMIPSSVTSPLVPSHGLLLLLPAPAVPPRGRRDRPSGGRGRHRRNGRNGRNGLQPQGQVVPVALWSAKTSGKLLHNYGQSLFLMGQLSFQGHFQEQTLFVYQRVLVEDCSWSVSKGLLSEEMLWTYFCLVSGSQFSAIEKSPVLHTIRSLKLWI